MEPANDQNDRIKFRAARIRARKSARDGKGGQKKSQAEAESNHTSQGQQQINNSLSVLDKSKAAGIDDVTSIRVEADARENERRIAEEERRQDRLRKLQEEAVLSGKRNAAVEMRWVELWDEIDAQKRSCNMIIESKERLIRQFQVQLKMKDEEYVKAGKCQAEDVEAILERMTTQYKQLQADYDEELDKIEVSFLAERGDLLSNNKVEIDALFEKRRSMEMQYMDDKQKKEEEYQREIEELRVKDAEDYNKLKIKLETDIQTLEQQLEEMRATYQLNTEKLEYNYRVLTERDMENMQTLQQQKRKLTRLKDALSQLMQKCAATDAADKHRNQELTEEYRRITKQYKDLQAKFRHFEIADNKRYREVWAMHEEELSTQVNKVLQADRIIHEQQLGMQWTDPRAMGETLPGSVLGTRGAKGGAAGGGGTPTGGEAGASESFSEPEKAEQPAMGGGKSSSKGGVAQGRVAAVKVKRMLTILGQEAGFLVDAKVKDALATMDEESQAVVQADTILKALGVQSGEDVQKLIDYFFGEDPLIDEEDPEMREGAIIRSLKMQVAPDDVVRTVQAFINERNEGRRTETLLGKKISGATAMEQAAKEAEEARRERDRREEREFWNRMANVISDKNWRIWCALEKGLGNYNQVLKQRKANIDEVSNLENQNAELKRLLSQYLGSRVNDDLIVPPTQMIRVDTKQ